MMYDSEVKTYELDMTNRKWELGILYDMTGIILDWFKCKFKRCERCGEVYGRFSYCGYCGEKLQPVDLSNISLRNVEVCIDDDSERAHCDYIRIGGIDDHIFIDIRDEDVSCVICGREQHFSLPYEVRKAIRAMVNIHLHGEYEWCL